MKRLVSNRQAVKDKVVYALIYKAMTQRGQREAKNRLRGNIDLDGA